MKLKTKFQDEDFELGEVVDANVFYSGDHREGFKVVAESKSGGLTSFYYNSIKDFTDQWEDAPEEPKGSALDLMILTLTNFIENEPDDNLVDLEDCKQMLEKLRAWRRLKDKGLELDGWKTWEAVTGKCCMSNIVAHSYYASFTFRSTDRLEKDETVRKDLKLLFGGEE